MKSTVLAGVFAAVIVIPSAYADISSCPTLQEIKQTMDNGGHYEISWLDGHSGSGEHPQATTLHLADVTFHDARYDAKTQAVICTYKDSTNNDTRFLITLKPILKWNLIPAGDWKGTYCEALEIAKCSFTHQ